MIVLSTVADYPEHTSAVAASVPITTSHKATMQTVGPVLAVGYSWSVQDDESASMAVEPTSSRTSVFDCLASASAIGAAAAIASRSAGSLEDATMQLVRALVCNFLCALALLMQRAQELQRRAKHNPESSNREGNTDTRASSHARCLRRCERRKLCDGKPCVRYLCFPL